MENSSKNNRPEVLIILVNYKKYKDTIVCLDSLKEITYPNYKVLVIDNSSGNESVSVLRGKYSDLNIVELKKNLGFAGGNNVGIKHAIEKNFPYILLLNNDTSVKSDFLDLLMDAMLADEETGIAGAMILYPNSKKIWCQGGGGISWLNASAVHKNAEKTLDSISIESPIHEADFITGACMLIKSDVIRKIGLIDESYFMYLEDLDFCLMAKKYYKFTVNTESYVYHHVGSSTGGVDSFLSTYYVFRNKLFFIQKHLRGFRKGLAYIFYFLYSFLRRQPVWMLKGRFDLSRAQIQGMLDFFKGKKGIKEF